MDATMTVKKCVIILILVSVRLSESAKLNLFKNLVSSDNSNGPTSNKVFVILPSNASILNGSRDDSWYGKLITVLSNIETHDTEESEEKSVEKEDSFQKRVKVEDSSYERDEDDDDNESTDTKIVDFKNDLEEEGYKTCILCFLTGKLKNIFAESDKDTSEESSADAFNTVSNKVNSEEYDDSGYEADDEGEEQGSKEQSNKNIEADKSNKVTKYTKTKNGILINTAADKFITDLSDYDSDSSDQRRSPEFSSDYLDVDDIFNKKKAQRTISTGHGYLEFEPDVEIPKVYTKNDVRELRNPVSRKWGYLNKPKQRQKNTAATSSDSSESSSQETDEKSVETTIKPKAQKSKKTNNRFQIVNANKGHGYYAQDESDEKFNNKDTSETIEPVSIEKNKKSKIISKSRIPGRPEHYMQSFGRQYKEGQDFRKNKNEISLAILRKRMQHFLPKRYHWDPSDFQRLGYLWFNGPQGISPGPWKISY